ncbi:putative intracellular septation protein A [Rickettsia amblyommatis str. Darkwater]|uniref:Putative intracellular septation protein A n=1 Tax=Rickettsia amblyommatis str. Ac/Pa TaxID=1359164 RepID=A0A0F3N1Z9_RICAM|nr:putative intracellular septation protein A [Rickettsia amblyommatis str. Ac/Pa]KJV94939.1 putative intracellular septation protein A [Rickettsia amblyommatis str. Darkwater]
MPVVVAAVKIAGKQADRLKERAIKIRTCNIITIVPYEF